MNLEEHDIFNIVRSLVSRYSDETGNQIPLQVLEKNISGAYTPVSRTNTYIYDSIDSEPGFFDSIW